MSEANMTSNMMQRMVASAVTNAMLLRQDLIGKLLDGEKRDLNFSCHYPDRITIDNYQELYDREGVAARVVNCMPEESWAVPPHVYETEESDETEFEVAWEGLVKALNIWHYLERIDALSGIGAYGVLLLGFDDGLELKDTVEGIDEAGEKTGNPEHKLLYLRAFSESVVKIKATETKIDNPRYGQPTAYSIGFKASGVSGDVTEDTKLVHWSRVIHVADGRLMSEVLGTPRLQSVYNRLLDLRKLYGGSAEMFWKGAFPGYAFETMPELAEHGVEIDKESLREELDNYSNGLQRYLAIEGVHARSLAPQVANPKMHVENALKAIAISKSIPLRILFGSEQAELASSQDRKTFNSRLSKRQETYLSPMLLRPLIDRLIAVGALPEPEDYTVNWPDLNTPTDKDKAEVAKLKTDAMAAYVSGDVDQLMPPEIFLAYVLEMTPDEVKAVLEAQATFQTEEEEEDDNANDTSDTDAGDQVDDDDED